MAQPKPKPKPSPASSQPGSARTPPVTDPMLVSGAPLPPAIRGLLKGTFDDRVPAHGRDARHAPLTPASRAYRAAARGVTPLEVLLEAMRHHHRSWRTTADTDELRQAAVYAEMAAPYVHPKMSSMSSLEIGNGGGARDITKITVEFVSPDDPIRTIDSRVLDRIASPPPDGPAATASPSPTNSPGRSNPRPATPWRPPDEAS